MNLRNRTNLVVLWATLSLGALGCTSSSEDSNSTDDQASDSGSVLTDSLDDSSGSSSGEPGTACSNPVFPNPLRLPDSTGDASGSNGLSVTNLATDHPYLTPNGDGHHDDTVFTTSAVVGAQHAGQPLLVNYDFEIYSTEDCTRVDTDLSGTEAVSFDAVEVEVAVNQDFDDLQAGEIVTSLPDMSVSCTTTKSNRPDACVAFETTGKGVEHDLRTGDLGRVLIFPKSVRDSDEDGLVDKPDDDPKGGTATFTFDEPVRLDGVGFLDIDQNEAGGSMVVTTADGDLIEAEIPTAGNAERQTIDFDVEGVVSLEISLVSSGAITHIDYTRTEFQSGDGEGAADLLRVWDATSASGQVADGGYIFRVVADLVAADGTVIDTVESPFIGMLVDSNVADYEQSIPTSSCDSTVDGAGCQCPAADANCSFIEFEDLVDLSVDPAAAGAQFITTMVDPFSGRSMVVADVTDFNGGGLIPVTDGVWSDVDELQTFVSELTGVPPSTDGRLFNFDYVQIGYSTAVDDTELAASFNNVLLDLITDGSGNITIGGETTNIFEYLNQPFSAPDEYLIDFPRSGDECTRSGGFNGSASIEASFCVYAEAILLDSASELGVYSFRSSVFDIDVDEEPDATRELVCDGGVCGVRTYQSNYEISLESIYYTNDGTSLSIALLDDAVFTGPSISRLTDRLAEGGILSGECSRAIVEGDDVRTRMDSADGAVGDNCIINGIFD